MWDAKRRKYIILRNPKVKEGKRRQHGNKQKLFRVDRPGKNRNMEVKVTSKEGFFRNM